MDELEQGWQIGFITQRGAPAPRDIADQIAKVIGWEITELIDADAGCYMTSIRPRDVRELDREGYIEFNTEFGQAVGYLT